MLESAIEIGVATCLAYPQASDDELRAHLERAGVEPWLAARLVTFLPLALGRVLLAGATVAQTLDEGEGERPLAGEPVFLAAETRARRASKQELEAIGLRSSEVQAVNTALHHGSRLEDLVLSPVRLLTRLPPPDEGHGGVPSPRLAFQQFLEAHGHAVTLRDGELRCGALQLEARVFPRVQGARLSAQVDFAVRHPALAVSWLLESFAGFGATWREVLGQCIDKFQRASLHVLIAGLLERSSCADQVSWERLEHPGGAFDLCLGAQLTLYAREPVPDLRPLVDALKGALAAAPLSRAVHALRLYVCFDGEQQLSNEVLLDNEAWPAGEALAAANPWPRVGHLWATRFFFLLVPAA